MSDEHSIFGLRSAKKKPAQTHPAKTEKDSGAEEKKAPVEREEKKQQGRQQQAESADKKDQRQRSPRKRRPSRRKPSGATPAETKQTADGVDQQKKTPEAPKAKEDKRPREQKPRRRRSKRRPPRDAAETRAEQNSQPTPPAKAQDKPVSTPAPEAPTEVSAEKSAQTQDAPKSTTQEASRTMSIPQEEQKPLKRVQQQVTEVPEGEELPEITLADLPEALQAACARAGWTGLMPVQARAIPYLLANRDLMIQSRTGSGKTGSFALPIMDRVDISRNECQALILVPTRELAQQVAQEIKVLSQETGLKSVAVFGGTSYKAQLDAFRDGVHVVVGTPGRVLDHLLRGSLSLKGLDTLIFDEADRMLSIGFYPDMKQVQSYLPRRKVNMLMTSATYPPHVLRLAGEFMDKPQILSLSSEQVHVADTPHVYYQCPAMQKDRALVRIIELENPATGFIFCNTKQHVHYLTTVLQRFGYNADELSGDLTQGKRERVLKRMRDGSLRFLVATDVAARGIDIPDLSHVFMYEPPEDHEVYIHRAGRTGRAGASGEVISLVDVMERLALERIGKTYKIKLEKRELPSDEDLAAEVSNRVTTLLEARFRTLDSVTRERSERFLPLVRSLSEHEDLEHLMAMLLDDCYQQTLHSTPQPPSTEDVPEKAPERKSSEDRGNRDRREGREGRERREGRDSGSQRRPSGRGNDRRKKRNGGAPQKQDAAGGAKDENVEKKADKPEVNADASPSDSQRPKRKRRPRRRKKKNPAGQQGNGAPKGTPSE